MRTRAIRVGSIGRSPRLATALLLFLALLAPACEPVLDAQQGRERPAATSSPADASARDADAEPRAGVFFEDPFEKALRPGWTWVRPVEGAARITDGVLRVHPSSGTLWEADNTGTNILLRPAPADEPSYTVEVTIVPAIGDAKAPGLYEQAGLLWYADDDNYVKLCMEYYEDRWWVVLGAERSGKAEYAQAKLDAGAVRLRLTITDGRAIGAFRDAAAKDWQDAGSFELPKSPGAVRLGLLAQTGPDEPDRHVGFDRFAIRRLAE